MNPEEFKLRNAPIVEAIVDIDCDMPAELDISALEKPARDAFHSHYPKFRKQFLENHRFEAREDQPVEHSTQRAVQALHFVHDDERQLVQVRAQGYTFNRLAPYSTLDDYLSEIERTWGLFRSLASPVKVVALRMRYINRIMLPLLEGSVDLDVYLQNGPKLPDEKTMSFAGFLHQYFVIESETGHQANIVLTSQPPEAEKYLPVILDISVAAGGPAQPDDWNWIIENIQSLRKLKNRIFRNKLTEQCLDLLR